MDRKASLRVPPLTFGRVTWARMSFSEPLVCSGISGRSRTFNNSGLLAWSRANSRSSVKPVILNRSADQNELFELDFESSGPAC